jgi:hypothetical protein
MYLIESILEFLAQTSVILHLFLFTLEVASSLSFDQRLLFVRLFLFVRLIVLLFQEGKERYVQM